MTEVAALRHCFESMPGEQQPVPSASVPSNPSIAAAPPLKFTDVYHKFFDFVWASTRRLGVDRESIDDIVQEVFIVVHRRLHTLEDPDAIRSWIYGIVRRTVSHYHRMRRAKKAASGTSTVDADSLEATMPTPFELTEQNDQVKLLEALLSELSVTRREVFVLAEIEELSVPEIAQALEIPLNTAYSRLRAARQAFEEGLARRAAREPRGKIP